MATSEGIVVEQVSKQFGNFIALNRIDLRLPAGGCALLAGPNGAGKSTLLRLLAGIGRPTRGRVLVSGDDPHRSARTRSSIGLLSHQTLLYDDLTAGENLLFFARLYGLPDREARIDQALDEVGLADRREFRVRTFSRGMKQRLALARATLHQPAVLLFDEPFTGLDQVAATALSRQLLRLRGQGRTCVLVTHRLDEAVGLIDHLVLLRGGRIRHQQTWTGGTVESLNALYSEHLDEPT